MSAVKRRGASEPHGGNSPSRYQDFKRHQRVLARPRHPVTTSSWLPDSSFAQQEHRTPVYVSFVTKAILWDRRLCHHADHDHPYHRPSLCPRFLAHMKARPEDLRPPCFLSSKPRQPPHFQGKTSNTQILATLKTQTLEGLFHPSSDRRGNHLQREGLIAGRRSALILPHLPLPAAPTSLTINETTPQQNTPRLDSGGQQGELNTVPASLFHPHSVPEERDEVQEKEPQTAVVSFTESNVMLHLDPPGLQCSQTPTSSVSQESFSDFAQTPSSLFSCSTDLASGRISGLSADVMDTVTEGVACFSSLKGTPMIHSPLASCSLAGSNPCQSSTNIQTTPALSEQIFGQLKPLSPRPTSSVLSPSNNPSEIRHESAKNLPKDTFVDPVSNLSLDSDHGLTTLAFPSTTWSSCPSPQRTTPQSGSGPKLTPPDSVARLESHHWPVLPPISSARARCGTAASRSSELSCSQSQMFDELEAIAPRSTSSPSMDEPLDSSSCISPDTELSPGLAALTVGCDSGNLGSLSRVQLLLLDRPEPETLPSPFSQDDDLVPLQDYFDLRLQYPRLTSSGALRPLTAGSVSEEYDLAGEVLKNKLDQSEGHSGSPSSWIIDPSPSYGMFRSASSPCGSSHGSSTDEEELNYPGWRDQVKSSTEGRSPDNTTEENDRRLEDRKTKALNLLSKLHDDMSRQHNAINGRSNFEDFDFLAKYCIFSQEKLAVYKRVFEEADSDGDGYISCLQVLLALKNIVPPELLSDEEEIYVYRILEMVDFRVTDGLVDLKLFAVISSLAQKIATMDDFMRSLISNMDFHSLEVRLFKVKQLFLFLLEEKQEDVGVQQGFISGEQLLLELKAGGIHLEQEATIRRELQHIPPLDLLDFLAYLPLFMLIHSSVISNPLDDSSNI